MGTILGKTGGQILDVAYVRLEIIVDCVGVCVGCFKSRVLVESLEGAMFLFLKSILVCIPSSATFES